MSWWNRERPYAHLTNSRLQAMADFVQDYFDRRAQTVWVYGLLKKEKNYDQMAELGAHFDKEFPYQRDADMVATWEAIQREMRYRRRKGLM